MELLQWRNFVIRGSFSYSARLSELNGVVDAVVNPSLTTTMKGYLVFLPNNAIIYDTSGWSWLNASILLDARDNFNACLPLKMLLGFAEYYRKVLLNIRQELILIWSNFDKNAVVGTEKDVQVTLTKIYGKISPDSMRKLRLRNIFGRTLKPKFHSPSVHFAIENYMYFRHSIKLKCTHGLLATLAKHHHIGTLF